MQLDYILTFLMLENWHKNYIIGLTRPWIDFIKIDRGYLPFCSSMLVDLILNSPGASEITPTIGLGRWQQKQTGFP